jgi:hypothetical protein
LICHSIERNSGRFLISLIQGIDFVITFSHQIYQEVISMSSPAAYLRTVLSPEGATILDPERDSLVRLNPIGSYIWQSLQVGKGLDDIAHELASETGADLAIVNRDVCDFVNQLKAQRLLES